MSRIVVSDGVGLVHHLEDGIGLFDLLQRLRFRHFSRMKLEEIEFSVNSPNAWHSFRIIFKAIYQLPVNFFRCYANVKACGSVCELGQRWRGCLSTDVDEFPQLSCDRVGQLDQRCPRQSPARPCLSGSVDGSSRGGCQPIAGRHGR